MNYIELINRFWGINREYRFNASETALYFHLLHVANSLRWKNPFREGNISITASIGLSESTIQRARIRLVEAKLIEYTSGKKKRELTEYFILGNGLGNHLGNQNEYLNKGQSNTKTDTEATNFNKQKQKLNQNYISISGDQIFDIDEYLKSSFSLQLPNWQELFPLANLSAAAKEFLLEKAFQSFKDRDHFKNSFARKLKELQEKNQRIKDATEIKQNRIDFKLNRPGDGKVKGGGFGKL